MSRDSGQCKLFLGDLPQDVEEKDVRDLFEKFGKVKEVKIINKVGNIFGFIIYEDSRDASDALKESKFEINGKTIRVEFGNDGKKKGNNACFSCGELNHIAKQCPNPRRDNYRGSNNRYRSRSRSNDRYRRRPSSRSPDSRRRRSPDTRRRSPERRYRRSYSRDRRSPSPRNSRYNRQDRGGRYNNDRNGRRSSPPPQKRSHSRSLSPRN